MLKNEFAILARLGPKTVFWFKSRTAGILDILVPITIPDKVPATRVVMSTEKIISVRDKLPSSMVRFSVLLIKGIQNPITKMAGIKLKSAIKFDSIII